MSELKSKIPGWTIGGYLPFTIPREKIQTLAFSHPELNEDGKWMFVALLEGMKGCGISNPNPSVGCVIVKDGKLLASGATEAYKLRHAERVAFDSLSSNQNLEGATVYVTLEPCAHQGHQPPCTDLFLKHKVKRVVTAVQDPFPLVSGKGLEAIQKTGAEISNGILGREAALWNMPFLAFQRLKRTVWIGKWAQTPTGLLAADDDKPAAITGELSQAYGHWLRQKYDAILVGARTILSDSPRLTARVCRPPILRQPTRVVVDLRNRISNITPELLTTTFSEDAQTILLKKAGTKIPKETPKHIKIAFLPGIDLISELQTWTATEKLQSIYVEGGASTLRLFLERDAFDILHVFTGNKKLDGTKHRLDFKKHQGSFNCVTRERLEGDLLEEYVHSRLKDSL